MYSKVSTYINTYVKRLLYIFKIILKEDITKLIEGEISTKELLELFGTDKQKENYIKNKKLNSGNKSSIIKKASKFCE